MVNVGVVPLFLAIVLVYAIVVFIEAIVLYRLGWTWGRSFIDALLLNLASTVAGCFLYPALATGIFMLMNNLKGSAPIPTIVFCVALAVMFLLGFIVSVAIELYVLTLLRGREDRARFKKAIIVANLFSGVAMMILLGLGIYQLYDSIGVPDMH
jgi:hypothetical protein